MDFNTNMNLVTPATFTWYWSMMWLFNFLSTLSLYNTSYPTRRRASPGLYLLKNVNDSGVRKLAINSNSALSAGKRHGRLCQTLGPCRAVGSHFSVFSEYPQVLSVVYHLLMFLTCWMVSKERCMHVIEILMIVIILCVFEPMRPHSNAEFIYVSFIHHRHD